MSSLLQQIKSLDANKQNTLTSADTLSLDALTSIDVDVLGNATVGGDLLVKGIELNTQIATATSGKQDKLTPGTNITIDENNVISSSGGGGSSGSSAYFLCSLNLNYTSLLSGNYARFPNIVFQNPTATSMVDINNGQGYTIQEDGLYHIGFSLTALDVGGTVEIGILYVRNGVETVISRSGIAISLTEDRSIIWPLEAGDIVAIKYLLGNAGYLTIYGSTTNDNIKTNLYGYKIG